MKFLLYLCRWQLSTPILAIVSAKLAFMGYWGAAVIANLIGGCIFFWVDRLIFQDKIKVRRMKMKRLTERDEYGNADIIGFDGSDWQGEFDFDGMNTVTEALNRLAAYEETGLEPEEITQLKENADVIPAKRGKWLPEGRSRYCCTACNCGTDNPSLYCSYCGADMGGK